jgi:acyl-CoA thioesterase-1
VALGANDALRGVDPKQTRASLDAILTALAKRRLPVLLAGMKAPRNLGTGYAAAFDPIYEDLAKAHGALLYPFILEGVATVASLNQPDGMHPNAAGVDRIVKGILPKVEELLVHADRK